MTIAIVDDCNSDQILLSEYINRYWTEYKNAAPPQIDFFPSGERFLAFAENKYYDIVLLDYYMDGMTGLQVAKEIRQWGSRTTLIFVTINLSNAVDGYMVDASGYLLKPFSFENFTRTFDFVLKRFSQRQSHMTLPPSLHNETLPVDDIIYCDIEGHYVQLHLADESVLRARMTFLEFCRHIQEWPQFLTCYRGCIVNMNHISKVEELNFLMDSKERVPFRKRERGKLLKLYSDYLFHKVRSDIP